MKKMISTILATMITFSCLLVHGISVISYENLGSSDYESLIDVIDDTTIVNEELKTKLSIARMDITATCIFRIGGKYIALIHIIAQRKLQL